MARGVSAVSHDADDLTSGFWVVVITFEGDLTAVRMDDVVRDEVAGGGRGASDAVAWPPLSGAWRTSLDRTAYVEGVAEIRRRIEAGTVYQVNLCRVLSCEVGDVSVRGLGAVLAQGNPAPYAATIDIPEAGLEIACASPEVYLTRRGSTVTSSPISSPRALALSAS